MFKNMVVNDLLMGKIYEFPCREAYQYCGDKRIWGPTNESLYLEVIDWIDRLFKDVISIDEHNPLFSVNDDFWWIINEAYKTYFEPNPDLPTYWLAIAKWALKIDYIPSNFYEWALPILEWFDLDRWAEAYHPQQDEYEAIKRDLAFVLAGLKSYPKDRLAPPVDEDRWGEET